MMNSSRKFGDVRKRTVGFPVVPSRAHETIYLGGAAISAVATICLMVWGVARGSLGVSAAVRFIGPGFVISALAVTVGLLLRAMRLQRQHDLEKFHQVVDEAVGSL